MGLLNLLVDEVPLRKEFGEILFTDYGIFGPPILQLSREPAPRALVGHDVKIIVDLSQIKLKKEIGKFLECHFAYLRT